MPMTRIVAYAEAAEKEPTTAHITAKERSAGVAGTGLNIPSATCMVPFSWPGESTGSSRPNGRWEKMKLGRAINKTPPRAIIPEMASLTVNGSCIRWMWLACHSHLIGGLEVIPSAQSNRRSQ